MSGWDPFPLECIGISLIFWALFSFSHLFGVTIMDNSLGSFSFLFLGGGSFVQSLAGGWLVN
jgi:hypothetical protein